jgi:hypothetical protein
MKDLIVNLYIIYNFIIFLSVEGKTGEMIPRLLLYV